jgi:DNA-binding LacI/PurR family transcriptional regulator
MEPVRREFLKDIATARMREAIASGLWRERMPSEAVLCRELHVSRRTVRAAIAQLIRENWLQGQGRGSPPAIIAQKPLMMPVCQRGVIRYLSPRPKEENDHASQVVENAVREYLGQEGFHLEFECRRDIYQRFSAKRLEGLTSQANTAAWLLLHSTPAMQKWFASSGLPCVVTGSCHEGITLPNVEFDFFESSYHAFHQLLTNNGRHLVMVAPERRNASEKAAVRGFLAAAERFPRIQVSVTRHDGSRSGICRSLEPLCKSANRPTGFLVMLPEHALTTLGFLYSKGIRVPEDASVISRTSSQFLDFCIPTIAHYAIDCVKFGEAAAALALEVVRHGPGRLRSVKLLPSFIPGQTMMKRKP